MIVSLQWVDSCCFKTKSSSVHLLMNKSCAFICLCMHTGRRWNRERCTLICVCVWICANLKIVNSGFQRGLHRIFHHPHYMLHTHEVYKCIELNLKSAWLQSVIGSTCINRINKFYKNHMLYVSWIIIPYSSSIAFLSLLLMLYTVVCECSIDDRLNLNEGKKYIIH